MVVELDSRLEIPRLKSRLEDESFVVFACDFVLGLHVAHVDQGVALVLLFLVLRATVACVLQ